MHRAETVLDYAIIAAGDAHLSRLATARCNPAIMVASPKE
jgi:hypothetical protein